MKMMSFSQIRVSGTAGVEALRRLKMNGSREYSLIILPLVQNLKTPKIDW